MKKKKYLGIGLLFVCCFLAGKTAGKLQAAFVPAAQMTVEEAKLAVIIDDFGYNGAGTAETLALDIPFTAAVLPFSSHTAENAAQAKAAGKEVIIHMPMESLTGKPEWVGDGAVCRGMSAAEVRQCMEAAYSAVPQAAGVNNHMGSAVMEDANTLGCVLDVVREKGGVFVDSVTTAESKCGTLAGEKGVKLLERDVFLDSTTEKSVVEERLREAAEIAKAKGSAVAIGHVGPEGGVLTARVLAEMAPELEKEGIRFVTVSELADSH